MSYDISGFQRAMEEKGGLEKLHAANEIPVSAIDVERNLMEVLASVPNWKLVSLCQNIANEWYVGLEHKTAVEWQQRHYVKAADKRLSVALALVLTLAQAKEAEILSNL